MIRCRNVRSALPGHVSGLSGRSEHERVEEHLVGCPACRSLRDALAATVEDLRRPFPGEEEIDWGAVARRTVERARAAGEAPLADTPGARRPSHRDADVLPFGAEGFGVLVTSRWARGAAAAVAALAIVAGVYLGVTWSPSPGRPGPARSAPGPARVAPGMEPGRARPASRPPASAGGAARREDLLRAAEAISARRQVAGVLVEARDVLWALSAPVPCGAPAPGGRGGSGAGDGVSLAAERRRSRQLLYRARLLEPRLAGSEAERAGPVWRDVEQALLDVESLPDCAATGDLDAVRRVAQDPSLMTRLDVAILELGGKMIFADGGPLT